MKDQELKVVEVPTDDLIPYANNANVHTTHQIDQIVASIEEFGFCDPIAVWTNEKGQPEIIEGHGRVLAAKRLGYDKLPVIYLDGLSDEQRRAYTHVHNQLTRNSVFDVAVLDAEIEALDFDWEMLGFDELEDYTDEETLQSDITPEYEFTESIDEENNYIVLKFDTDIDWLNAQTVFGLKRVEELSTRQDGTTTEQMRRIGIGRVIDGVEAIKKLQGDI